MHINCVAIREGGMNMYRYNNNQEVIGKYIDNLSDEYKTILKNTILEEKEDVYSRSVSNYLGIDNEIKMDFLSDLYKESLQNHILEIASHVVMILGIFFMIIALVIGFNEYEGVTITGTVIWVIGIILLKFKDLLKYNRIHTMRNDRAILNYCVIITWIELEIIAANIYSKSINSPGNSIISSFLHDNYINREEAECLRDFLRMRNNIIHDTNNRYKPKEINDMLKKVQTIIKKLKNNSTVHDKILNNG